MNLTSFAAAAAAAAGLPGLTVGIAPAPAPVAPISGAAPGLSRSVLASPWPTDISWSWDWEDDDEDWSQTASWDCPAGCSITFEDW